MNAKTAKINSTQKFVGLQYVTHISHTRLYQFTPVLYNRPDTILTTISSQLVYTHCQCNIFQAQPSRPGSNSLTGRGCTFVVSSLPKAISE